MGAKIVEIIKCYDCDVLLDSEKDIQKISRQIVVEETQLDSKTYRCCMGREDCRFLKQYVNSVNALKLIKEINQKL